MPQRGVLCVDPLATVTEHEHTARNYRGSLSGNLKLFQKKTRVSDEKQTTTRKKTHKNPIEPQVKVLRGWGKGRGQAGAQGQSAREPAASPAGERACGYLQEAGSCLFREGRFDDGDANAAGQGHEGANSHRAEPLALTLLTCQDPCRTVSSNR